MSSSEKIQRSKSTSSSSKKKHKETIEDNENKETSPKTPYLFIVKSKNNKNKMYTVDSIPNRISNDINVLQTLVKNVVKTNDYLNFLSKVKSILDSLNVWLQEKIKEKLAKGFYIMTDKCHKIVDLQYDSYAELLPKEINYYNLPNEIKNKIGIDSFPLEILTSNCKYLCDTNLVTMFNLRDVMRTYMEETLTSIFNDYLIMMGLVIALSENLFEIFVDHHSFFVKTKDVLYAKDLIHVNGISESEINSEMEKMVTKMAKSCFIVNKQGMVIKNNNHFLLRQTRVKKEKLFQGFIDKVYEEYKQLYKDMAYETSLDLHNKYFQKKQFIHIFQEKNISLPLQIGKLEFASKFDEYFKKYNPKLKHLVPKNMSATYSHEIYLEYMSNPVKGSHTMPYTLKVFNRNCFDVNADDNSHTDFMDGLGGFLFNDFSLKPVNLKEHSSLKDSNIYATHESNAAETRFLHSVANTVYHKFEDYFDKSKWKKCDV